MLKQKLLACFFCFSLIASAQSPDSISETEVSRIINILASDSLQGRGNYTFELFKAAHFIAEEFETDSLLPLTGLNSYFQPFTSKSLGKNESLKDSAGRYDPSKVLLNVIGVLPGRSLANEVVIFSAHFDHVGMGRPQRDRIFNGANDDASGTTALIALAHYFAARRDNERTLVFCAFSGEELGLFGSTYFADNIENPAAIVAGINIEMIGIHNVVKKNSFFLTGSDYSDMYNIMKKNLAGQQSKIVTERSFQSRLFQRSDNFSFAKKGIPAHTIMCSDDEDPCYHMPCDEVKRIDLKNMTEVIRGIAIATRSIVAGTDTPKRIDPSDIR
jgi:Zn-dependent M28 family amino/carboxypeptidase